MDVGTKRVSEAQLRYLRQAQHAQQVGHPEVVADVLMRVARDSEIREGTEQLHPDWLGILKEILARPEVLKLYPPDDRRELAAINVELNPFDPALAEIDPQAAKVSFLLGAGASKPEPSKIPTVKELLPELLERARRLDREDVTRLADFCDKRKIDNIEDLLTAAHMATFCSRNPIVLGLLNFLLYRSVGEAVSEAGRAEYTMRRRYRDSAAELSSVAFLQDTLQVLFGLLSSTMLPARPNAAHQAIALHVKAHPGSAIVTTNYDCCMDLALGEVGRDFKYQIEFGNFTSPADIPTDVTRLIKLHGSLNWFYCETCQEVQLLDIARMVGNFLSDKAPYPVIGICRACGGQSRGLLVPPLAMKFDVAPPLTHLSAEADAAFGAADIIVIVGFSFADADNYITRMLSKSMQTRSSQKLVIVDPEWHVAERLRRKFKASIPNFAASRIMRMAGSCSEVLPKLLQGELLKQPPSELAAAEIAPAQSASTS